MAVYRMSETPPAAPFSEKLAPHRRLPCRIGAANVEPYNGALNVELYM